MACTVGRIQYFDQQAAEAFWAAWNAADERFQENLTAARVYYE
ncbi:hypothetical protein [Streptomyces sp. NBC_01221]|nr:hypothetical protein [Streptomyces sp. NBC_01221]